MARSLRLRLHDLLDKNISLFFMGLMMARWLAFWLDMASVMMLAFASFGSVALKDSINASVVGLGLSYIMQLTGVLAARTFTL